MSWKTEGIILRVRNLGEADRLVTLYTKEKGKLNASARGARRIRNRLLSPSQVFTHGRYMIFPGKGLHNLSQADIINSNQILRDDLEKFAYASYVTELLDAFTPEEDPAQDVFHLLAGTLSLGAEGRFSTAVRFFEIRLMKELGYEPELYQCLNCRETLVEKIFFSEQGGAVCSNCRNSFPGSILLTNGTWELMKKLLEWNFSRIGILHPAENNIEEMKKLMRKYLDYRLEYPLKSLGFLETLQAIPPQNDKG
ncbi:MAG: DNA repair protein RecO [Bacillota bacterium]|nr:DNA repair protein RecO [Bacillota bacterium]HHU62088.1 DNA repair protein RecO [Natronincola sp.]